MNKQKTLIVLNHLLDEKLWKPNITELSKRTGIPISTLFDFVEMRRKEGTLSVQVRLVSELELIENLNLNKFEKMKQVKK